MGKPSNPQAAALWLAACLTTMLSSMHPACIQHGMFPPRQVEFADVLVLNKVSAAGPCAVERAAAALRALNPGASVMRADFCRVDPLALLHTRWRAPRPMHSPPSLCYGVLARVRSFFLVASYAAPT